MEELLLVNPRRRRKSRKGASPAQKRARAAFAAMARARRKNPSRRRKHRARRRSSPVFANPRVSRRHRRRSARRSNPIRLGSLRSSVTKPMAILTPALVGALGATAVNTALSKLPLPASLNTGRVRYLTQGAAAIILGMIAQKVGMKAALAAKMAEGSLTVTLHSAIQELGAQFGVNLGGMGYYLPGRAAVAPAPGAAPAPQLGGVGKYVSGPGSVTPIARGMGRIARGF